VIAGWLAKIVIVIALLGLAAVELGSPLWTRAQLDGIAHDAADDAAAVYNDTHDALKARAAADSTAKAEGVVVTDFQIPSPATQNRVRVTVFREARSYVLHNFGPTKKWYDVSVEASSVPKAA
jgi:Flp pilus assembly protein TadG